MKSLMLLIVISYSFNSFSQDCSEQLTPTPQMVNNQYAKPVNLRKDLVVNTCQIISNGVERLKEVLSEKSIAVDGEILNFLNTLEIPNDRKAIYSLYSMFGLSTIEEKYSEGTVVTDTIFVDLYGRASIGEDSVASKMTIRIDLNNYYDPKYVDSIQASDQSFDVLGRIIPAHNGKTIWSISNKAVLSVNIKLLNEETHRTFVNSRDRLKDESFDDYASKLLFQSSEIIGEAFEVQIDN